MYIIYFKDRLTHELRYMNCFKTFGEASEERDRLHRVYGGEYVIQWEEA